MMWLTVVRRDRYVWAPFPAATWLFLLPRMRAPLSSYRLNLSSGLLLCLLLVGCKDAPTVPASLQQLAGGQEWVAMPAPRDLPGLSTWLPHLERGSQQGAAVVARIEELTQRADGARREGRLAQAAELEQEAERIAVLSLARFPEAGDLLRAMYAVDFWAARVQAEVALERAPELAAALEEVKRSRVLAAAQLSSGDTTSAVLHLAAASQKIRSFTPTAVALRVLSRAEEQLRARPARGPAVERALHLLNSSRQELLTGDPRRALRRALYALQLAHGDQVPTAPAAECVGPACGG